MKRRSDKPGNWDSLREKIIGLGEQSIQKSYYPQLQRKLEESEFFRSLLDHSLDSIFLARVPTGELTDMNDSACRKLGYTHGEMLQMTLMDLLSPAEAQQIRAFLEEHDPAGKDIQVASSLFKRNGDSIPVETTISLVKLRGSVHAVAVMRDITERKQAEESLRKSVRTYRLLIDNTTDMVSRHMPDSTIIYITPSCQRMLGYKVEDMVGHPIRDFVVPEDLNFIWAAARDSRKTGENRYRAEFRMIRRDGSVIWAETLGRLIYNEQGNVAEVHSAVRDITERKHSEEALRTSESFLSSIIDQTPYPMWISDEKGTLIRINQACRDTLHVSDDEVLGKYNILKDNIVEEQGFLPMVKRVFEYGDTVRFEISYDSSRLKGISMKKNVLLYLDVTMFPILDAMGRIANVVVQHQDITERKRAQEALVKSEEKFSKVFRGSSAAIAITRISDGLLIDANEALERLLGYSHDELIGHTTNDLGLWVDQGDREQLMKILAEKRSLKDHEIRFRAKDGGICTTQYSADVVEIEGEPCILSVLVDITGRKQAEESLKKSERIYRLLVDNATDMVSRHLPDSTIIYTTPSCRRMLGYKVEDMVGHPASDFVVQEDMDNIWAAVRASQKAGDDRYRAEFRMIRRDGSVIWAETLGRFIYDEKGNVTEIHSVVREITERKQAERALKESEDKYRSLFENAIEGIFQTTLDGRILMLNTSLARMLGYNSPDEAKKKVSDIGSQIYADPEKRKTLMNQLLREGKVIDSEILFKNADGHPVKVMLNFLLVNDRDGTPRYIEGSCIDITDRWQVEEALKASEEQYRSIFENATEGIYQTTPEGRYLSVNPAFVRMFGYSSPEDMIESVHDIGRELYVNSQDRVRMVQMLKDQGIVQGYEVEVYRRDRTRFWISINIHTVRDASGNILYFEGTNTDITERKHAEMALRESEMHIREIINNAPFGAHSYELQDDGRLIFTGGNNAADRILNLDHSSLIGLSIEEAFPMHQTTALPGIYREVARTGRHWEQDVVFYKDNSIAGTFEMFAFQTGTGRMTAFFHDITERKKAEEALRVSEARYRRLYDSMRDAFVRASLDGTIVECNDAYLAMLGYDADEIKNLTYQDITPDKWHTFEDKIIEKEVMARGYSDIYEKEYRRKDGTIFPVELRVYLLLDDEGEPSGMWKIVRDITERKLSEERLKEANRKLMNIIEFLPDATLIIDSDKRIIAWNRAIEEMTGVSKVDIIGRDHFEAMVPFYGEPGPHLIDFIGKDDTEIPRRYTNIIHKGDSIYGQVYTPALYQGKGAYIRAIASPLYDNDGNVIGAIESIRDITDRQRAQEAIEESEARYRLLAENATDNIFTMDLTLGFTYISPSIERLRGYTVEEAMHQSIEEILTPASLKDAMRVFQEEMELEASESIELWRKRTLELEEICKDGSTIWTETTFTLLRDEEMRLTGFLGITRDITERRQAAEEKLRLETQLSQAQKMESIGTLAGGIAHDFNNILAAIIGYSELAIEDLSEPEKVRSEISEVLKAGDRARDLVSQILTFSRKTDISYSPLALKTVIKESLKMMRSMIPTTIEIKHDISDSGLVFSDPTQINQIIMNLCTNAAHAMDKAGGVLEVSLKRVTLDQDAAGYLDVVQGTYLRLTISDTGHGMPPEVIARIFEPYFTTKEMGRGTGLGLSVVHGIVKSHKGAITCRSVPEKGTTFDIYLPVIESAMNAAAVSTKQPYPVGTERVLFIDDEAALADLTGKMLTRLGYTVTVKTNSVEAFESFRGNPDAFDLVITDMTMPAMTGEMVAQGIMEIRPDIPIILCTGYSEHISEEKARGMGIREFLLKPIEMATLARTIRKVLDER